MRDEVDLVGADAVHLSQERRAGSAHDDQPLRQRRELVHHAALERVGLGEDGVQGRDDRHPQLAQQLKDVTPGLSTEDAVLVLDADDIDRVDVQEVGGPPVRRHLALRDLEANAGRVGVTPAGIVHREDEALDLGMGRGDRAAQIRGERGDPALARQVVAEHRDLPDRAAAVDGFDESSDRARERAFRGCAPDRHARRPNFPDRPAVCALATPSATNATAPLKAAVGRLCPSGRRFSACLAAFLARGKSRRCA